MRDETKWTKDAATHENTPGWQRWRRGRVELAVSGNDGITINWFATIRGRDVGDVYPVSVAAQGCAPNVDAAKARAMGAVYALDIAMGAIFPPPAVLEYEADEREIRAADERMVMP
jgi:hypothetical protein